jgi:hypothetical protein
MTGAIGRTHGFPPVPALRETDERGGREEALQDTARRQMGRAGARPRSIFEMNNPQFAGMSKVPLELLNAPFNVRHNRACNKYVVLGGAKPIYTKAGQKRLRQSLAGRE